jgi:hypothetical protein
MLRPLQQHSHFADCLRAAGRDVVERSDGVLVRRRVLGMQVSMASRAGAGLLEAELQGAVIFNAEHAMEDALRTRGFLRTHAPMRVAEWDLSRPDLRAGLRKTWRHALERSDGVKLALTHMPSTPDHWMLMAEQAQARARRYRALPLWITRAWATLHPKDTLLVEARLRGVLIAGMVFLRHGDVATYHISHTSPDGRAVEAHRAMLFRAATHFVQRGVVRMDLGLIDPEAAPGLARFKRGTGAVARDLGGTWVSLPGVSALKRKAWGGYAKPRTKMGRGSV